MNHEHWDHRQVAILGGTGPQGRGLARRFAAAGIPVLLGSRDRHRADAVAKGLAQSLGPGAARVRGGSNAEVAAAGEIVLVVVPWDGHGDFLTSLRAQLAGKVVVDCVNPIGFDSRGAHALSVPEGSAAQQAQALLPDSTVVAAFHHLSAVLLDDPEVETIQTDVLVLGDNRQATDLVEDLATAIPGARGVYGGRLRNAHQVEALTANLISTNRRYKTHAGVRVTGL